MFDTVEAALADLRQGKLIIVTDDEDRENEGDLICAGEFATPDLVNFMATYGKGLICMPISETIAKKLSLPQMVAKNTDNHETAFTVAIDHIDTTTGISAFDRSLTARACADPNAKASDFRRPGHLFPLTAKAGGVLVRNGHTEATVDLMKLAGLSEVGLCCEVMADDGTMMRLKALQKLAQTHQLTMISIQQLQAYKKQNAPILTRVTTTKMPTKYGEFVAYGYVNQLTGAHHIALVKGDLGNGRDIICRVHSECLTGDVFGSLRCDCGQQFAAAMTKIEQAGRGVLLYLRQEGRGIGLINKLRAYELQEQGLDTLEANLALRFAGDARDYYEGAQILKDLDVETIRLLTNNPDKVHQLEKNGVVVKERVPLQMPETAYDLGYLQTKQVKMGHLLDY